MLGQSIPELDQPTVSQTINHDRCEKPRLRLTIGCTDRAVPLLEEAGVAALVATRVPESPLLSGVVGKVAGGTGGRVVWGGRD